MTELQSMWKKIVEELKNQVDVQTYDTWFKRTREFSFVENTLTIKAPTKFFADWLEQHYQSLLHEIAYNLTGQNIKIYFIGSANGKNMPSLTNEKNSIKEACLNPRYTFDRFIVGPNNSFACAAAKAVAENPGKKYNPLFIYGGVGLGKTHLMQAIGNYILKNKINKKISYIPTEDFINEMISSIQTNTTIKFRNKYRNYDVLMVDDIHFLSGKEGSQEEFFHTFNKLYNAKKQIVLTSDRPPKDIQDLQERLVSRFEWGLLADIKIPINETRMAIIKQKCKEENITLKNDIIEFISENFVDNIRQLEGALLKIFATASYQNIRPEQIKFDEIKEILADLMTNHKKPITLDLIQEEVAKYFNLGKNQIKEPTRKKEIAFPRQIAMYLSTKLLDISLLEIANHYNKKDHTTVIHSKKIISQKLANNLNLKSKIDEITENISSHR